MNKGKAFKLRSAIVQAADSLPVETAIEVPELYMKWYSGEEFTLDINNEVPFIIRRHNDILYKLIQVHTTQDNWTPDVVPAFGNFTHQKELLQNGYNRWAAKMLTKLVIK